mgnify:CR=1 FL=1|tara:strand:+ start:577 stop:894 length:318 start_codon:yes stop_codon:yes gene_type:complete
MPKGGLSYKSLRDCLDQAKAKGLPASNCDILRGQDSKPDEITPVPPPSDPGTRGAGSFKEDLPPVGPGTNIGELGGINQKKGLNDGTIPPYPGPNPKKKYGKLDK